MNISEDKKVSMFQFKPLLILSILGLITSIGVTALDDQIERSNCQKHLCNLDKAAIQKEISTLKMPLNFQRKISSINVIHNELIYKGLKKEEDFADINQVRKTVLDEKATELQKDKAIDWLTIKYENLVESSPQTRSNQDIIEIVFFQWGIFTVVFAFTWFVNSGKIKFID